MSHRRPPALLLLLLLLALALLAPLSRAEDSLPRRTEGFRDTRTLHLAAVWGTYPLDRTDRRFHPRAAVVSPDGRLAVVAAEPWDLYPAQRGLLLYDLSANELVAHIATSLSPPTSVSWSPDGSHVVTGHKDSKVRVIAIPSGAVTLELDGHKGPSCAVFAGDRLLSGAEDGKVLEWDEKTATVSRTLFATATSGVDRLVTSRNGRRLAVGTGDFARVFDLETGAELLTVAEGGEGSFTALALSTEGDRLAVGRASSSVELHDVARKERLWRAALGHRTGPTTLDLAPDGKHLVAGGGDHALLALECGRGAIVARLTGTICLAAGFAPDGASLIAAGTVVERIDFVKRTGHRERDGHAARVTGIAATKGATRVVTSSADGTLKVWERGRVARTLRWPGLPAKQLSLTANGAFAVASRSVDDPIDGAPAARQETVALFDLERGIEIAQVTSATGHVEGIALAADAEVAVSVGTEVHRWELPAGTSQRLSPAAADPQKADAQTLTAVAVAADGAAFLVGGADGRIELRATKRGGVLGTTRAHDGSVLSLAMSPNGERVLSVGGDGTVQLRAIGRDRVVGRDAAAEWTPRWSVRPEVGDSTDPFSGGGLALASASFSPDGERVLVVTGRVEVRDVRSGALLDTIDLGTSGDLAVSAAFLGRDVLVGTEQGVVLRFTPR